MPAASAAANAPSETESPELRAVRLACERGNFALAVSLLKPLAQDGNPNAADAQYQMGLLCHLGQGVPRDQIEATRWWRVAADKEHVRAQNDLALAYARGQGVPNDMFEASRWFKRAAENGFANAQFNLGSMFEKGMGVVQNMGRAVKWYKAAADLAHAKAQMRLAALYQRGRGVDPDPVEAHKWYNIAGAMGEATARNERDTLSKQFDRAQLAEAQRRAREWWASHPHECAS